MIENITVFYTLMIDYVLYMPYIEIVRVYLKPSPEIVIICLYLLESKL